MARRQSDEAGPALFEAPLPTITPPRRLSGRLVDVYATPRPEDFTTVAVGELDLRLDGIAGDRHFGFTRPSGSREPWYERRTEIRSRRQLSLVSVEELRTVADNLGVAEVRADWIGANLLVEGIPQLSFLPSGTRLHLSSGAVVLVEHMNGPCRHAGKGIAVHYPDRDDIELGFVPAAKRRRGVVATVDRAGLAKPGDAIDVFVPEQWTWSA